MRSVRACIPACALPSNVPQAQWSPRVEAVGWREAGGELTQAHEGGRGDAHLDGARGVDVLGVASVPEAAEGPPAIAEPSVDLREQRLNPEALGVGEHLAEGRRPRASRKCLR